ncbi:alpha/beta hydrolase [Nocardioides caldifontis]|uniref:alpha/beta hydrolase n=1 Tax=Nocardioides caldifontis TaxID=2588938 RepID=UPI0011DFD8DD|nr:alpha/beta hydrolase [Nocardioides caldifontis]
MALHPQARAALERAAGEQPVHSDGYDVQAAREQARAEAAAAPREEVAEALDLDADGVRCRLLRPHGAAPGVVVHLHGGGFVFHDIDVHDAVARSLANRVGVSVLNVDYRRPPEHRFPAAPDDVDTVLRWLDVHADELGVAGPAYVHGDSAGGNLALVAALRNPGRFRAVVLTYPFLDPRAEGESYRTAADGFDPGEAAWYWQQYAAGPADLDHPDLAPLRSDRLHTLPPTLVVTAEHDPLRDEGERLAAVLAEEGVTVVGIRFLGQLHGFWRHHDVFDAAEPLTRTIAGFLRSHHP